MTSSSTRRAPPRAPRRASSGSVDVGQQRFLAEVVLDDRRHVGVDELVVADSVSDRAGDHDVARAAALSTPPPEDRVRFEVHGVEIFVIDAPVDDVDLAFAVGGPHVDGVVPAKQIGPRRVRRPSAAPAGSARSMPSCRRLGEHDDGRVGLVGGGGLAQCLQQMRCVVTDARTRCVAKRFGKTRPWSAGSPSRRTPGRERRLSSRTRKVPARRAPGRSLRRESARRWRHDPGGLA